MLPHGYLRFVFALNDFAPCLIPRPYLSQPDECVIRLLPTLTSLLGGRQTLMRLSLYIPSWIYPFRAQVTIRNIAYTYHAQLWVQDSPDS